MIPPTDRPDHTPAAPDRRLPTEPLPTPADLARGLIPIACRCGGLVARWWIDLHGATCPCCGHRLEAGP